MDSAGLFIHPTALVDPNASLGANIFIGPWCIVGPDVVLRDGVKLHASVIIEGRAQLGERVEVYPFTTLGMAPQDQKYSGESTSCIIGDDTIIRENVTIHRGTSQGDGVTRIGRSCLIMANAHVAHDCTLGDEVIIVNNVVMGGHVQIGDQARVMGSAAIHQFVRIGKGAVIGGLCGVEMDVLPYGSVLGNRARLVGLNWVGLKRSGVNNDEMQLLRRAFRLLYPRFNECSEVLSRRIEKLRQEFGHIKRVIEILDFMEAPSRRGLTRAVRRETDDYAESLC